MMNTPKIEFDFTASQPIGGHGFRRGNWTVLVDGQRRTVYCSVPHAADLASQRDRVLAAARRKFGNEPVSRSAE